MITDRSIVYKKGFKYQLVKPLYITVPWLKDIEVEERYITVYKTTEGNGQMILRVGYAWDGPSGPAFDTPSFMRASGFHDGGYQLMRLGYIPLSFRKNFDQKMYDICIEDGMWKIRAKWCLFGVRKFAKGAASPENLKKTLVAPKDFIKREKERLNKK